MTDITVIFAIKNRDRKRAENCINSLINQDCKIIVVDYGSDDLSWYSEVFGKVGFIAVRRDTEHFNKSRALNIAIRQVSTPYVISSDIDNIFDDDFISEIKKIIYKKGVIALTQKRELDESGKELRLHPRTDYGSCFGIDVDWLRRVYGYDEKYTYWGREDDDIFDRAVEAGFIPVWTEKPLISHQWHKKAPRPTFKDNVRYYEKMKREMKKTGRVHRNDWNTWGLL